MNEKVFSIIVPVYNVELYLKDCIDSLIKQDFGDYEILLVDDGSTDGSAAICLEYAKNNNKIRYLYKENGGLSDARNYGISNAVGKYLLFIDSDDFLVNDKFLSQVYGAICGKDIVFFTYLLEEYNADRSKMVKKYDISNNLVGKMVDAQQALDVLYVTDSPYITMAQNKIIERKFLIDNGLYFQKGIYHEDDEWLMRVLFSYPKMFVSDIVGYGYRHRDNSIIRSVDLKSVFKKCCDKIFITEKAFSIADIKKYRSCITYFAYYYMKAFNGMKASGEYRDRFLELVSDKSALRFMKYSRSLKHKLLYLYACIFGKRAANKIIMKKYG